MRVWQAVVLMNLALAAGLGVGYAAWGRRADALAREVGALAASVERLERERRAYLDGGGPGQQQWEGRGVVRAAYPQLVVITHEEIRGLLPARTTGFPAALRPERQPLRVGAPVRFTLRGTGPDDAVLVAAMPW